MLDSLVRSANVAEGDRVLEIGPGTGTLTERMLAVGARVQAVELDHRLAGYLRDERFKDDKLFSLTEADACRLDLDALMGDEPFRCVANLPYSCSSQLLASLTSMANQPQDIHVLLQKEMADRLTAKAGTKEYGVLTVRLGLLYEISIVKTIPKNVFFPPPEVVSAFVRMRLRPKRPPRDVMASVSHVAGLAFGQRRKKTCRMLEPEYGAERVADPVADFGDGGHLRDDVGDFLRAEEGVIDWLVVEEQLQFFIFVVETVFQRPLRQKLHKLLRILLWIDAEVVGGSRDGAVHQSRVDVEAVDSFRQQFGIRALA